jgi:transposase
MLTDTLGLILCVVVTAANSGDREGLKDLLNRWFIPGVCRLRKLWVDAGYGGEPLRQWVVERAFGWLGGYRRHSKDYETLTRNSEAMVQISMINLLTRRLA